MEYSLWSIFTLAYLGITLSPGPNVLLVLTHAGKYGLRSIGVTMLGNLFCQLIIVIAVAFGVSTLLTTNSNLYHMMKYAGAVYLIYLGLKLVYQVFAHNKVEDIAIPADTISSQYTPSVLNRFFEAIAVSASNPKTVIFLSAFLPQFLSVKLAVSTQFITMYLTIAAIVISVHTVYAMLFLNMKTKLPSYMSGKYSPLLPASIYVALGFTLGMGT